MLFLLGARSRFCEGFFRTADSPKIGSVNLWITLGCYARDIHSGAKIGALGGVPKMKTAAEYRALAEECFQWARETHDRAVRAGYLGLARIAINGLGRNIRPDADGADVAPGDAK
jgi:hypothetical protein